MRLGRLNGAGIQRFREWLTEARKAPEIDPPYSLLTDEEFFEPVPAGADVELPDVSAWWAESDVSWIRKLRVALDLQRVLKSAQVDSVYTDQGLWSWLSLCYLDVLTVDADGVRKLQNTDYYYILDVGIEPGEKPRRRYPYRHQLLTPFRVIMELGPEAGFLLGADVRRHGEAVEQLLGRLGVLRIPAVSDVVTKLYFDPNSPSGLKKGSMNKARKRKGGGQIPQAGGLRDRFPLQVRRLERNYDIYSVDAMRLIELLGPEFQDWQVRGQADAGSREGTDTAAGAGSAAIWMKVDDGFRLSSGVDPRRLAMQQGVLGAPARMAETLSMATGRAIAQIIARVGTSDHTKDPPVIYLNFASADREHLPKKHKGTLTLIIDGVAWQGTIGMPNESANYTHTWVVSDGSRRRLSDLLHEKRAGNGDDVRFDVLERGVIRWSGVVGRTGRT